MALALEGVRVRLGAFTLAADLAVARGARVAVMGPSGGGKSTLLNLVAGFLRPERGRVLWDGRDVTAAPPGERPMAVLFQDGNLFPHLTALQNVALALRPSTRLRPPDRARAAAALAEVGLAGKEDRRPAALSGGEAGRAALARVLLQDRPLLLMDEPFAALGPAQRAEMLALALRIAGARGATILMVTHDPLDARALGGEVVVVAEGRAAPPVPVGPLLDAPPPALAAYLGRGT